MTAAVRIRTTLTSDTPHLPELAPLVGRRVEIIVIEDTTPPPPAVYDKLPAEYPWPSPEVVAAAEAAVAELRAAADAGDYDWDAWRKGRELDRQRMAEEWRRQVEEEQS